MERLTKRICGRWGVVEGCELNTVRGARKAVDRLAAYEDTGLEPEEITDLQQTLDMYGGWARIQSILEELDRLRKELPNDPLTLDELREMDREPVYVSGGIFHQWGLVHVYYDHDIFNGVEISFPQYGQRIYCWNYGNDAWLAYRRKPEEGTTCQK